jgi:hypothetical protein
MLFYDDAHAYKVSPSVIGAVKIRDKFVSADGPMTLNLDWEERNRVSTAVNELVASKSEPNPEMFSVTGERKFI